MNATEYRFGSYRLLPAARELWDGERMVAVTRLAFDCLAYLAEHRQRAVGRDELVAALWGRVDVAEARVSELMLRARRTVGDDGQQQNVIRTVPGFGYRWVAETEVRTASAAADVLPAGTAPIDVAISADRTDDDSARRPSTPAQPADDQRRSFRTPLLFGIFLLLLIAAAATFAWRARQAPVDAASTASAALIVVPLEVDGPRDAGWVRLGAMDLIADRLRSAGLPVPPSESVLLALHGAAPPLTSDATEVLTRSLGAGGIVAGKATRSASGWKIVLDTKVGGVGHRVEAEHTDVIEAAHRSADLLLAALGRQAPADQRENVALEERLQQAQAALLANELATARSILESLAEPERNDPRVRYRLAAIDFRSGRLDEARAAFGAMLEDPAVQADALLKARVLTARGKVAFRRTDFAAAVHDLDDALASLPETGAAQESADALATRGAAHVGLHQLDAAAPDLGRARSLFQEAGNLLGVAQADTNLGLLEAERGRPDQALSYLLDAAQRFETAGAVERLLSVRTAVFDTQLLLLRWSDALATSDRQWALRDRAGDPGLALLIGVDRARALAGLGRYREARGLLADLAADDPAPRPEAMRYLHAIACELAWREARMSDAVAAADRALAGWPDDAVDDQRARVVLLRQRALIAMRAAAPATNAEAIAAPSVGDENEAASALLVARAESAQANGDADGAERAYRSALARADVRGVPSDVAGVAESYVPWLLARGRLDEASALAGRVAAWAERDFDCAMLQVAVYRARANRDAWAAALRQAQALAGERVIPAGLSTPPD